MFKLEKEEEEIGTEILCIMTEDIISTVAGKPLEGLFIPNDLFTCPYGIDRKPLSEKISAFSVASFPSLLCVYLHWSIVTHRKDHRKNEEHYLTPQ